MDDIMDESNNKLIEDIIGDSEIDIKDVDNKLIIETYKRDYEELSNKYFALEEQYKHEVNSKNQEIEALKTLVRKYMK